VAPQALIDAVLPLVNLQARKLGVRIEVVPKTAAAVLCDRTMVEQVLLNLARNAMQAMDEPRQRRQPRAALRVRCRGGGRRRPKTAGAGSSSRWPTWAPASARRWPSGCSRPSSPPRPTAWASA
jgi:signal transduction histidine kinase